MLSLGRSIETIFRQKRSHKTWRYWFGSGPTTLVAFLSLVLSFHLRIAANALLATMAEVQACFPEEDSLVASYSLMQV
jgi:hypothetical protein